MKKILLILDSQIKLIFIKDICEKEQTHNTVN